LSCSKHSVSNCIYQDGKCVDRARLQDIVNLRNGFWGNNLDATETESREQKMTIILLNSFDQKDRSFSFFCGDLRVCESGFLLLLGISKRESRPPKHWRLTMKEMQKNGVVINIMIIIVYVYKY
jgi:hypothetical protein